jgi:hypothetical protein
MLSLLEDSPCLQVAASLISYEGQPWTLGWHMSNAPLEWELLDVFFIFEASASGLDTDCRSVVESHTSEPAADMQHQLLCAHNRDDFLPGSPISVIGSPFACLQPGLLCGCVRHGHISNSFLLSQTNHGSFEVSAVKPEAPGFREQGSGKACRSSVSSLQLSFDGSNCVPMGADCGWKHNTAAAMQLAMLDVKALPGALHQRDLRNASKLGTMSIHQALPGPGVYRGGWGGQIRQDSEQ